MKIFISHSSKTPDARQRVAELAAYLETLSHTVWYDKQLEGTGGQVWWDNILTHLVESDIFVFVLTPTSLASFPCELEYTYADALRKSLLPVMLEPVDDAALPPELQQIQFVDFRQQADQQKNALKQSLAGLQILKLPKPLPTAPEAPTHDSVLFDVHQKLKAPTLTRNDQHDILTKLRIGLKKTPQSALLLLRKFDRRDDLLRDVSDEVQSLLAEYSPRQSNRSPVTTIAAVAALLITLGVLGTFAVNALSNRIGVALPTNTPTITTTITATDTATATFTLTPSHTVTPTVTTQPTQTATPITPTATFTAKPMLGGGTGKIAFVANNDNKSAIWLCDVENCEATKQVLYESDNALAGTLAWSPDGRRLAFRLTNASTPGIYVIDVTAPEGSNSSARRLTRSADSNPSWSPDGKQILFRRQKTTTNFEFYVMNAETGEVVTTPLLSNGTKNLTPKWSRDNRFIVFSSNQEDSNYQLWIMSPDGTNPKKLTSDKSAHYQPAISPDSKEIIYSTDYNSPSGYALYILKVDGSEDALLYGDGNFNTSPDVSPDGKWIVFASSETANGVITIKMLNLSVDKPTTVIEGDSPVWQP